MSNFITSEDVAYWITQSRTNYLPIEDKKVLRTIGFY